MSGRVKGLVALGVAIALLCGAAPASAQAWPSWMNREPVKEPRYPEVTVTAEWLASRLGSRELVVIDARPEDRYHAGHIPGALSLSAERLPDPATLSGLEALVAQLGSAGLSGSELLVCCGQGSWSPDAARVFWLLEVAGAERVFLLEGGTEGWSASGKELGSSPGAREARAWDREPVPERSASREYVRRSFGEPGVEIIDARGQEAWHGRAAGPDRVAAAGTYLREGHIPHALPFDFASFLDPDGTFRPAPDTWREFGLLGPRPSNPVDLESEFIVHGSGHGSGYGAGEGHADDRGDGRGDAGAMGYFLLRRAGIANVRLYDGGWQDWADDPYLPVVRIIGAEELQQRLAAARSWFRPSAPPSSFVLLDVRHPADYAGGHIRGAANLRSDYIADSLDVVLERSWPGIDRRTTPIVTYCYGEYCIRSRATSTSAARQGFIDIERFYGGLAAWRSIGGQLVKSE